MIGNLCRRRGRKRGPFPSLSDIEARKERGGGKQRV